MMVNRTDWHRDSWDRFLRASLPELLSRHCTLSDYRVVADAGTVRIRVSIETGGEPVETWFDGIPYSEERGVFVHRGEPTIVVPISEDESLQAVDCVGDMAARHVERRLVPPPNATIGDESSLRLWAPLCEWLDAFFCEHGQRLDTRNRTSELTHLRRVVARTVCDVAPLEQVGRVCPFETPEGPDIGRVLTVALGAEIAGGEVVMNTSACGERAAVLGPAASFVPLVGASDPARILMGTNMMRQWAQPLSPEQALVRTGLEPEQADFWCGTNLLTAFCSAGRATWEDALVLSESAAERMRYEHRLEVGDRLSNRHGQKGVISRIVPDSAMPRLSDGRRVECQVSFIGLHTRMNTGQLWEALYGLLAERGALDGIVGPMDTPDAYTVERLLVESGLPADGMVELAFPGANDRTTVTVRAAVGIVYWGRTAGGAAEKLRFGGEAEAVQIQGEMECNSIRNAGAWELMREINGALSEESASIAAATGAIRSGREAGVGPVSARYARLSRILGEVGFRTSLDDEGLSFEPRLGDGLRLPEPMPHPWRWGTVMTEIPVSESAPGWDPLRRAVERLGSLLRSDAPRTLVQAAREALTVRVAAYFDTRLTRQDFVVRSRVYFSGRAVLVPGLDITADEVGIPQDMAWALFGPFVEARVGSDELQGRTNRARETLTAIMAERRVMVNRAPTFSETAVLSFRPVLVPHHALELHPLVCRWLGADFDGDQAAVVHPLTLGAQRDLQDRLSLIGHLTRDPSLVETLIPAQESLWGLSRLSLTEEGRKRLGAALNGLPELPQGYLTATELSRYAARLIAERGPQETVAVLERAFELGVVEAIRAGGSMSVLKMTGASLELHDRSAPPDTGFLREQVDELFAASLAFQDRAYGDQLLAIKSGARGRIENLTMLMHSRSLKSCGTSDVRSDGSKSGSFTSRGMVQGILPDEAASCAMDVRRTMAALSADFPEVARRYNETQRSAGYNILARAARSEHPGLVVASAAATGETDPLRDLDARVFMGLPLDAQYGRPCDGES